MDRSVVAFGLMWSLLGVFQILYLDPIDKPTGISWASLGALFTIVGLPIFLLGAFSPPRKESDQEVSAENKSSLGSLARTLCILSGFLSLFSGFGAYTYEGHWLGTWGLYPFRNLGILLIALGVVLIIVGVLSYFHVRTK